MDIILRELDANQIRQLASPRESEGTIASRLRWNNMNKDWTERLQADPNRTWWLKGSTALPEDPSMHVMMPLRERLLGIGGESVCFNYVDEDLAKIMERGVLWDGSGAMMMIGQHNQCHGNSANIWSNNQDRTVVATGYALSEDGMWRQHSWVVSFDIDGDWEPGIVETTSPRVAYFGFPMTTAESEQFEYWNS